MSVHPFETAALIGFGEVGQRFAADLTARGVAVAACDTLFADPSQLAGARARHDTLSRFLLVDAHAGAVGGASLVVSCVTADQALIAARQAGGALERGQVFVDLNSVAPQTKIAAAEIVTGAGAEYLDLAVMGPVAPTGIATPMLLSGPSAARRVSQLRATGLAVEVVGDRIGQAAAIKLTRSIMVKGMEALAVECLSAARHFEVLGPVTASLTATWPEVDWPHMLGYFEERVSRHGRRRAAEMREAARMLAVGGLAAPMSLASAEVQEAGARRHKEGRTKETS